MAAPQYPLHVKTPLNTEGFCPLSYIQGLLQVFPGQVFEGPVRVNVLEMRTGLTEGKELYKKATIKDESGETRCMFFGPTASTEIYKGFVVEIRNFGLSPHYYTPGKREIRVLPDSQITVLRPSPEINIPDLSVLPTGGPGRYMVASSCVITDVDFSFPESNVFYECPGCSKSVGRQRMCGFHPDAILKPHFCVPIKLTSSVPGPDGQPVIGELTLTAFDEHMHSLLPAVDAICYDSNRENPEIQIAMLQPVIGIVLTNLKLEKQGNGYDKLLEFMI